MEWKIMSKLDASAETAMWQQLDKSSFLLMVENWEDKLDKSTPEEYRLLRNRIVEAYKQSKKKVKENDVYRKKKDYFTDLFFALDLYEILEDYSFGVRMASNDQVWMYLSVKILPDIVDDRYKGGKILTENGVVIKNINEERFWKTRRRIYLKVLWWYVYLSLQENNEGNVDMEETFNVLKDNSTDEIVQIVERSGVAGYRVGVYRALMKYYSENRDKYDSKTFRRVMVINTAKTKLVEPELIDGGVNQYVKELFEFVSK